MSSKLILNPAYDSDEEELDDNDLPVVKKQAEPIKQTKPKKTAVKKIAEPAKASIVEEEKVEVVKRPAKPLPPSEEKCEHDVRRRTCTKCNPKEKKDKAIIDLHYRSLERLISVVDNEKLRSAIEESLAELKEYLEH